MRTGRRPIGGPGYHRPMPTESTGPVRVRVVYGGRVQGVGFRASTLEVARPLAVTGWVRNEPDGSVVMEAQGAPDQVRTLRERIRVRMGRKIQTERDSPVPADSAESEFTIQR